VFFAVPDLLPDKITVQGGAKRHRASDAGSGDYPAEE
jgi:hypothetical protein